MPKKPTLTHAKEKCYHIFLPFKSDAFLQMSRVFMMVTQVFNTKGAARRLGCSQTWIHKLVAKGLLKAYMYNEHGELVQRTKDRKSQGQGLYFFARDVDRYQPAVQRRPRGSKNKKRPASDSPTQMA